MVATALTVNSGERVRFTAVAAHASGDIVQCLDGQAGVVDTSRSFEVGDLNAGAIKCGRWSILKTASMVFLPGTKVYFDRSTGLATILRGVGRFFIGICAKDAASADERVDVQLNAKTHYAVELGAGFDQGGGFTNTDTLGLGTVYSDGLATLAFDAVAEAALASIISNHGLDIDDGPIAEFEVAIFNIGDDAALDINFGLATSAHATDFDSAAQYVALHLDGNNLSLNLQSKDGTNNVAATDSTLDAVDDTFAFYQMDARDKSNIKWYRNGVLMTGATLHLNAFTGTLYVIVHVEKTSNDTVADVRVRCCRAWTTDLVVGW